MKYFRIGKMNSDTYRIWIFLKHAKLYGSTFGNVSNGESSYQRA